MSTDALDPAAIREAVGFVPAGVPEKDYVDCRDFLFEEAARLDARRYRDWLDLLAQDIQYRVTANVVRYATDEPQAVLILDDRMFDIVTRINQISNPKLTFAENPAPFIRRFVSNVRVSKASAGEFEVASNLLMYRRDAAVVDPYLISGARRDTIRRKDAALVLVKRHVQLDMSVAHTANLATFL